MMSMHYPALVIGSSFCLCNSCLPASASNHLQIGADASSAADSSAVNSGGGGRE